MGTLFLALAAARTAIVENEKLGRRGLAFGIVAPCTVQIAPLEKDGGADAWAVDVGCARNIKQVYLHFILREWSSADIIARKTPTSQ